MKMLSAGDCMTINSFKSMMSVKNQKRMTQSTSAGGWLALLAFLLAAPVAKSEEIDDLQVDSRVQAQGAAIAIKVSFASGGSCGLRISYGDGSTSDHKVEDTSQPLTITKQYKAQGTYKISAGGRTMIRGFNSLGGCDGTASASVQIVGEDEYKQAKVFTFDWFCKKEGRSDPIPCKYTFSVPTLLKELRANSPNWEAATSTLRNDVIKDKDVILSIAKTASSERARGLALAFLGTHEQGSTKEQAVFLDNGSEVGDIGAMLQRVMLSFNLGEISNSEARSRIKGLTERITSEERDQARAQNMRVAASEMIVKIDATKGQEVTRHQALEKQNQAFHSGTNSITQALPLEKCPCNWLKWNNSGAWQGRNCPTGIFEKKIGSRSPEILPIYSSEGCTGKYQALSGREYAGVYKEGRFSGKSMDGWSLEMDIDGEPTGRVKIIQPNGTTLEGSQLMGVTHGYAVSINKETNEIYEGNYTRGLRNGMGKLLRNGVIVYEGEWIYGQQANVVMEKGRSFANEVRDAWKSQRGRDELTGRSWVAARLDQPIGEKSSVTVQVWCGEQKTLSYRLTFNQAIPTTSNIKTLGKVATGRRAENEKVQEWNFKVSNEYSNVITGSISVEPPHGLFEGGVYRLLWDIPTNVGNVVIKVPPLAPSIQAVYSSCK